jgi:hypothetical protein
MYSQYCKKEVDKQRASRRIRKAFTRQHVISMVISPMIQGLDGHDSATWLDI